MSPFPFSFLSITASPSHFSRRIEPNCLSARPFRHLGYIYTPYLCYSGAPTRFQAHLGPIYPKPESSFRYRSQSGVPKDSLFLHTIVPCECLLRRDLGVYESSNDKIPFCSSYITNKPTYFYTMTRKGLTFLRSGWWFCSLVSTPIRSIKSCMSLSYITMRYEMTD